jgi:putative endonuclease
MEKGKLLGATGEDYAAYYLKLQGKAIVARNVHSSGGELDIIAYDESQNLYLLVEVKTRTNENFASGVEAVGYKKQKKMQNAAAHFFLNILRWPYVPEFEIHALILTPNGKNDGRFEVEYYDDLS